MSPRDRVSEVLRLAPAPLRRLLRYGIVGVSISSIYSLLIVALVTGPPKLNSTYASVIGFAITLPIAWVAHRTISFGDRPFDDFQPLRFMVSTGTSFALAVGGMYAITQIGGYSYVVGIAWNWLTIPILNFLSYLLWVFRVPAASVLGGSPSSVDEINRNGRVL